MHVGQLAAPSTRTYEGGVEQSFLSQHILMRVSYFHNQYGREIEAVGLNLVPQLLPNLTPAQKLQLESFLQLNYAYELYINSEAYRAQGIETAFQPIFDLSTRRLVGAEALARFPAPVFLIAGGEATTFEVEGVLTGFEFGKRKTAGVSGMACSPPRWQGSLPSSPCL